jgi:CheY-like chemotaxis protein
LELALGKVIALVDDLFFRARIAETARHTGVEFEAVGTGKELLERLRAASEAGGARDGRPALIILDLNARGGVLEALRDLQAAGNQIPVIAFLSHVQTELAEQARAAGCNEVMPRSKFTKNLAAILERAKAGVGE